MFPKRLHARGKSDGLQGGAVEKSVFLYTLKLRVSLEGDGGEGLTFSKTSFSKLPHARWNANGAQARMCKSIFPYSLEWGTSLKAARGKR
jgi:hypothetical protein